jgi:hypothetical protein
VEDTSRKEGLGGVGSESDVVEISDPQPPEVDSKWRGRREGV